MNITVLGLWHLGIMTASCLLKIGHKVTAFDFNCIINKLKNYELPVFEPGLEELIKNQISQKKLCFSSDINNLKKSEIFWFCYDTPISNTDKARY